MAEYMDPEMDAMEDCRHCSRRSLYSSFRRVEQIPLLLLDRNRGGGAVMTEMGAPPEMVDTMANALHKTVLIDAIIEVV